jgi:hypothetical protein
LVQPLTLMQIKLQRYVEKLSGIIRSQPDPAKIIFYYQPAWAYRKYGQYAVDLPICNSRI